MGDVTDGGGDDIDDDGGVDGGDDADDDGGVDDGGDAVKPRYVSDEGDDAEMMVMMWMVWICLVSVWICLISAWICLGGDDADDDGMDDGDDAVELLYASDEGDDVDDDGVDDGDDVVDLRYASNEAKVVGWFGFVSSLLGLGLQGTRFSFSLLFKCNLWKENLDWELIRNLALIPCYNS